MQETITALNFSEKTSKGFSVVKFWYEWCPPCERYDKWVVELIQEIWDKVNFFLVDVHDSQNIWTPESVNMKKVVWKIEGVPYVVFMYKWAVMEKILGVPNFSELWENIKKWL